MVVLFLSSILTLENITLLFSGIVALSTVVYALLTRSLVKETKRMREAQTEPVVSVIVEPGQQWVNFIDMVIRNIGLGPAYEIEFGIDPDFEYTKGKKLSELGLFKKGIPYLAPNQEIRFFLTSIVEDQKQKKDARFTISATYKNHSGVGYKRECVIDLSVWDQLAVLDSDLHDISKSLKKIAEKY